MATDLQRFYSTPQVARMFGVKVATVRDWIKSGKLQGTKLGGSRWRVSEEELRRFANEQLEQS